MYQIITAARHPHYFLKFPFLMTISLALFLLIAASLSNNVYAGPSHTGSEPKKAGPIVVTIKPLYSLVAHLSEGIETPILLMQQMQSPHHYNMKPSERRLLSQARLIFWLGPQLESYLNKIIEQQKSTTVVTALHAEGLNLLRRRHMDSHNLHSDTDHEHSTDSTQKSVSDSQIDPHIWLSIHNTIAISKQITAALIKDAPEKSTIYEKNLQHLLSKIEQTKTFVHATLATNKQPFVAYHDAFQYFEKENALNYIGSITFDEETSASLKHIRQINRLIKTQDIGCLVYQTPEPAIVRSLAERNKLRAIALDPLGQNIQASQNAWKNAWFEIMRQLAVDFHQCLTP